MPDYPRRSRDEDKGCYQRDPGRSQHPTIQHWGETTLPPPPHSECRWKRPSKGQTRSNKVERELHVSTKVSTLKPKYGSHGGPHHLLASGTSLSWPPFHLSGHISFSLFFKSWGSPWAPAGPLLKVDTLILGFLSISPTPSLQMETSTYPTLHADDPQAPEPSRPKLIQYPQISSSL